MQGNESPQLKKKFKVDKENYFPVYQVFNWLMECKNGSMIYSKSSHPLIFDGLTMRINGIYHIFMANFTNDALKINMDGPDIPISQKFLAEENVKDFMKGVTFKDEVALSAKNNIELKPYSINWLTCR